MRWSAGAENSRTTLRVLHRSCLRSSVIKTGYQPRDIILLLVTRLSTSRYGRAEMIPDVCLPVARGTVKSLHHASFILVDAITSPYGHRFQPGMVTFRGQSSHCWENGAVPPIQGALFWTFKAEHVRKKTHNCSFFSSFLFHGLCHARCWNQMHIPLRKQHDCRTPALSAILRYGGRGWAWVV